MKSEYKKLANFQYGNFVVPLYKYPVVEFLTVFIPMWLFAVITLGVFFQDSGLGDRLATIATLLIAYVALIPVIRQQVPPSPRITLTEFLVYFQSSTSLLAMVHSISYRNEDEDWTMNLFDNTSILFWISLAISLIDFFLVITFIFMHKIFWEPSYNKGLEKEENI